jgi:RES domain-containing protein
VAQPIKPHPAFKHLFSDLKKNKSVLSTQWNAQVYRCVEIKWARPEYLITGEGTRQRGSRWMQPNYCRVVHAASTETIALKESRRVYDYYGIQKPKNNPRVSVELIAKLHRLVDLTKLKTIMDSPTIEELLNEDWEKLNDSRVETTAQALGRAILELNFEGLIAPSSRDRRGRNLIWFPEQLRPESQIEIVGQEKLKQWLA